MDLFGFRRGTSPLLVSVPHAGTYSRPRFAPDSPTRRSPCPTPTHGWFALIA